MTHRAEASMHRFERGKTIVMRGIGDVLRANEYDNLATVYFLKETGGAGKLAAIARNFENSTETVNLAKEALRLISEDERFPGQREFATAVVSELTSGSRIRTLNAIGGPIVEGRA